MSASPALPYPGPRTGPCTAFIGARVLAAGPQIDVALAVKAALAMDPQAPFLIFDDATGAVIDLDLRGTAADVVSRLAERAERPVLSQAPGAVGGDSDETAPRGRGRPKLGVVAREVTLLPRHWEWLALQRGGASVALRQLVDAARRADGGQSQARVDRESAYRFLSAMAGDFPGFEEASRALFADDRERFAAHTAGWPDDVKAYAHRLAWREGAPPEAATR